MANLHQTAEIKASHRAVIAYMRAARWGDGSSSRAAEQIDRALAQADARLAALERVAEAAREALLRDSTAAWAKLGEAIAALDGYALEVTGHA